MIFSHNTSLATSVTLCSSIFMQSQTNATDLLGARLLESFLRFFVGKRTELPLLAVRIAAYFLKGSFTQHSTTRSLPTSSLCNWATNGIRRTTRSVSTKSLGTVSGEISVPNPKCGKFLELMENSNFFPLNSSISFRRQAHNFVFDLSFVRIRLSKPTLLLGSTPKKLYND